MTITGNFELFQYFNFEINFLKSEFFTELEYRFLVESTKIENATFSYKNVMSEDSVLRQIEWGVQNGLITKNGVFTVTTLFR